MVLQEIHTNLLKSSAEAAVDIDGGFTMPVKIVVGTAAILLTVVRIQAFYLVWMVRGIHSSSVICCEDFTSGTNPVFNPFEANWSQSTVRRVTCQKHI